MGSFMRNSWNGKRIRKNNILIKKSADTMDKLHYLKNFG